MIKYAIIIFCIVLTVNIQTVEAVFYECTYKNDNGVKVVSSFNPYQFARSDYNKLAMALKSGDCKELYIKKYLIDATSCNIQFYKYNGQIANLACRGNNPETMKKLKEIARQEFGYWE